MTVTRKLNIERIKAAFVAGSWVFEIFPGIFILHTSRPSPRTIMQCLNIAMHVTPRKSVLLMSYHALYRTLCLEAILCILYASKMREVPILWVAWSSFWVSKEPPMPKVTPGRKRTL